MTNMTYAQALEIAINAVADETAKEKLIALKDQMAKRTSAKTPTKTQKENEVIMERIVDALADVGEAVTVTNKKDGTAPFTPEDTDALKFDEKDIGKTFYYGVRESRGDDETVLYDERVFGYAVKLRLLERLSSFEHDKGKAEFETLFDGIQQRIYSL